MHLSESLANPDSTRTRALLTLASSPLEPHPDISSRSALPAERVSSRAWGRSRAKGEDSLDLLSREVLAQRGVLILSLAVLPACAVHLLLTEPLRQALSEVHLHMLHVSFLSEKEEKTV